VEVLAEKILEDIKKLDESKNRRQKPWKKL
jgi:hypothetical protein